MRKNFFTVSGATSRDVGARPQEHLYVLVNGDFTEMNGGDGGQGGYHGGFCMCRITSFMERCYKS